MVPQQVSFVERLSLSQRVPYWRFHCSRMDRQCSNCCQLTIDTDKTKELSTRNGQTDIVDCCLGRNNRTATQLRPVHLETEALDELTVTVSVVFKEGKQRAQGNMTGKISVSVVVRAY